MSKKLSHKIDYFEGFYMYAIAGTMKDYSFAYHLNNNAGLDLVNYEDIYFDMSSNPEQGFSWYHYEDKKNHTHYYLISNKSSGNLLIPSQKNFDFILLIKDALNDEAVSEVINKSRRISGITAVFKVDMNKVKDMDVLMETIELHELEFVKK